jgi:hypothetical protein
MFLSRIDFRKAKSIRKNTLLFQIASNKIYEIS